MTSYLNRNATPIYLIFVFAFTFLVNVGIRQEVIQSETLILDDLIYLPLALVEECIIPTRHPIDFGFICYLVGAESLILGRTLFIAYMAFIASMFFLVLLAFGLSRPISALAPLAIFGGYPVLSQTTFLTGSYPIHGILFITLALWLSTSCGRTADSISLTTAKFTALVILLVMAGIATSSLTLASLMFLPNAIQAFSKSNNHNNRALWLTAAWLPTLAFVGFQFSGIFSNHYRSTAGWISLDIDRLLGQFYGHTNAVVTGLGLLVSGILLFALLSSTAIYVRYLFQGFGYGGVESRSSYEPDPTSSRQLLLGIFLCGFAISIAPTLLVMGSPPRYTVAPLLFLFGITFICCDLAISKSQSLTSKLALTASAMILTTLSVYALSREHSNSYSKISGDQGAIRSALVQIGDELVENAQILLVIDQDVSNSTQGYNHWSTHFARFATGRQDIVALIGKKSRMHDFPFLGEFSNHGSKYWGERNGRAYRMQMVGLDENRPTYIYFLSGGKLSKSNCISLNRGQRVTIYKADETGINEWAEDDQNSVDHSSCAHYALKFDLPQGATPTGASITFNGSDFKSIKPIADPTSESYQLSFSISPDLDKDQSFATSKNSPPMPVLALPLAIYQTSQKGLSIALRCAEDSTYSFEIVSDWTQIALKVDSLRNAKLQINGVTVSDGYNCPAPTSITLGRGYFQRYWKGTISNFEYNTGSEH